MASFDRNLATGVYEVILRDKFGALYDWNAPKIVDTVGPFSPSTFIDFAKALDTALHASWEVLSKCTVAELEAISETGYKDETGVRSAWRELFSRDIANLENRRPYWASGGLGHPDYVIDFEYWARMPRLNEFEASALSVGVEPKHLKIIEYEDDEFLELLSPALVFAKRRAEQFCRQFHLERQNRKVNSEDLLSWINLVELEVHPTSHKMLTRFHGSKTGTETAGKRPDKRELDSVAALFTAMAIEQFGYVPSAKRSPTVKEIQDLAASLGISMSDDTIRHYLRHGAKFIDPEWMPNSR
jgi:hypothetical protein